MSQMDSPDYIYDTKAEFIEIEPLEDGEEGPPLKIKRLMCNINGCTYQTDRRRDMRRHKRSQKHLDIEYSSDSGSDFDRPPFSCKLCDYTTAKKFCFVRHVKSVRHLRKEQAAEEEKERAEKAGPPEMEQHLEALQPAEPALPTWETAQYDDNILFTCVPCDYSTTQRLHMARHNETLNHLVNMQNTVNEGQFIELGPPEEDEVPGVTIEELAPILDIDAEHAKFLSTEGGTFECTACEYKTARRFCFVRHVQSKKHVATLQELEEGEAILQENLDDIIEYAPAEEPISQEILYLPTDDDNVESAYYIIMGND